jgi:TIR domain
MAEIQQDVFLSHATRDKEAYIEPLADALKQRGVTFWLDSTEIGWGDNVTTKINDGLRSSRYALVCLSANFLERPWPEQEFGALLSLQNTDGKKRVLPLILNSRERVLQQYPLIAGLAYRDFSGGPVRVAEEVADVVHKGRTAMPPNTLQIVVESVHSGVTANLLVTPQHSVKWVLSKATAGLGLRTELDTGAFQPFHIRWVMVEVAAEPEWLKMSRSDKRSAYAVAMTDTSVVICKDDTTRIGALGLRDNWLVHLYAVEDESYEDDPLFIG